MKQCIPGKWHVGNDSLYWPEERGFDRHFSFINGAGSYYNLNPFWEDSQKVKMVLDGNDYKPPSQGYYLTNSISEYGLQFIEERDQNRPFFLYLAYTAPHWPLHALPEDIEKFQGSYKEGWELLREQRFSRMKEKQIISNSQNPFAHIQIQ